MSELDEKIKRLEKMKETFVEQMREIKKEIAEGTAENKMHADKLSAIEDHVKILEHEIRDLRSSETFNG